MDPFTHASRFSWQELFCREQKGAMCRFIIFGASGDLAKRKLFPALFSLYKEDLLHKDTLISCCARHSFSTETFRNYLSETLFHSPLSELEKSFLQKISYMVLDYANIEDFSLLAKHLLTEEENDIIVQNITKGEISKLIIEIRGSVNKKISINKVISKETELIL